jgi:hypothetical protein
MLTLVMGFVGLVIVPALILSTIFNRLIKEPVMRETNDPYAAFTISSENVASDTSPPSSKHL